MIEIKRGTKETTIDLKLTLHGSGVSSIRTGIGFFDHMLEAFSKHALIDLELTCIGDTHVDFHHSVEDVGIVIGQALNQAIFPVRGIERFASNTVILDEAAVEAIIDVSNRPFLHFELGVEGKVGDFDVELVEEFFRALVVNAGLSTHIVLHRGRNNHHVIEAAFKAFAVSLRRALVPNERVLIPSTKGVL